MLYHSVVRTAADRRFWYNFRQAQKTPTRRPPELAPGWLAGGDTVNSPLSESCVLFGWIYSAQSLPIGPSQELTRPHGLTRRDAQVSEKQRKWVGWKTRVDNAKSAGAKRPVGVRFPSRHRPGPRENPLCGPTFDPPQENLVLQTPTVRPNQRRQTCGTQSRIIVFGILHELVRCFVGPRLRA
jgi:hypothetical protein